MSAIDDIEAKVKSPERVQAIRRALYQLRRRQFIWAGDRGTTGLYDAIVHAGCLAIIEDHFELEGMILNHNTAEQWVGLMPDPDFVDIMPDERLNGDETLVLLLLALAWREGVNEANVGHRGVVETTAVSILDRLAEITGKERIKHSRLKDILKDFARRSLIAFGEEDPVTLDIQILVRPMIIQIAGVDALRRLEAFAKDGLPVDTPEKPGNDNDAASDDDGASTETAEEEFAS